MNEPIDESMRRAIERFAQRVGNDPLLIQGAGGNLSWKNGEVLWVKASGAWLANARTEDMFVPVDLPGVRGCIAAGRESYAEHRRPGTTLRPSIETALHALMPQRVVAHLHAVDALAFSVMVDGRERCAERLDGVPWTWIPYRKPGAELAACVAAALQAATTTPDVLLLANHGIVFCGPDVPSVERLADDVLERLRLVPRTAPAAPDEADDEGDAALPGYRRISHASGRSLATDPVSRALARSRWVLYPDHAVFLGAAARFAPDGRAARALVAAEQAAARSDTPCIVVDGVDVWIAADAARGAEAMLDCYAAVCARLPGAEAVVALTNDDIAALLDWEAERYRRNLASPSQVQPSKKNT